MKNQNSVSIEARPLCIIAAEIRNDWPRPNYAAAPHLEAMGTLRDIQNYHGCDSGKSIVAYFLCNAQTWKGETAKRIKKELNPMLKAAYK